MVEVAFVSELWECCVLAISAAVRLGSSETQKEQELTTRRGMPASTGFESSECNSKRAASNLALCKKKGRWKGHVNIRKVQGRLMAVQTTLTSVESTTKLGHGQSMKHSVQGADREMGRRDHE